MNILINYLNVLNSLDNTKICYIKQEVDRILFVQQNRKQEVSGLYFDFKRPCFMSPKLIEKNKDIIQKLINYSADHFVSLAPTRKGLYCQVFNYRGALIYAQYLDFYNTNWLQSWYLRKLHPELVLKVRRF